VESKLAPAALKEVGDEAASARIETPSHPKPTKPLAQTLAARERGREKSDVERSTAATS